MPHAPAASPAAACAVCALPLAGLRPARRVALRRLPRASARLRPPARAVELRGAARRRVQGLKFRRLDYLGRHLGEALAGRWGERARRLPMLVVPVPLHWRRRLAARLQPGRADRPRPRPPRSACRWLPRSPGGAPRRRRPPWAGRSGRRTSAAPSASAAAARHPGAAHRSGRRCGHHRRDAGRRGRRPQEDRGRGRHRRRSGADTGRPHPRRR